MAEQSGQIESLGRSLLDTTQTILSQKPMPPQNTQWIYFSLTPSFHSCIMSSHELQWHGLWIIITNFLNSFELSSICFGCSEIFVLKTSVILFDLIMDIFHKKSKYYLYLCADFWMWAMLLVPFWLWRLLFALSCGYFQFWGISWWPETSLLWIDFPPFMPPLLSHHGVDIPVLLRIEKNLKVHQICNCI